MNRGVDESGFRRIGDAASPYLLMLPSPLRLTLLRSPHLACSLFRAPFLCFADYGDLRLYPCTLHRAARFFVEGRAGKRDAFE